MNIYRIYKFIRPLFFPVIPLYLIIFYLKKILIKPEKFNIPVVCIGNITTGGTGKTPAVMEIASILKKINLNPGIVSRGYHGRESRNGAIVSDGKTIFLSPEESGDEPFLIAQSLRDIPVAVCKNRSRAIHDLIHRFDVNVVLMDDGFQNNTIYKDIKIIIIDATNPFGNGLVLPAGDLREPTWSLKKSDIIFVNKSDLISNNKLMRLISKINRISNNKRIFISTYNFEFLYQFNNTNNKLRLSEIDGKRILIITAIGNPYALVAGIHKYNPALVNLLSYPDHYWYDKDDTDKIIRESEKYDLAIITEKDFVKLHGLMFDNKFYVLKISMIIREIDIFVDNINIYLNDFSKN